MWDVFQRRSMRLEYISIDEHVTNVLTKPLSQMLFAFLYEKLGVDKNYS